MPIVFYFTIIKACPSFKGVKPTQNEQVTKLADFGAQGKAKPDNYLGKTRTR